MERRNKKVKKISPTYLRNLALWYLERFGGTRARVQATLMRRVQAAEQEYGPEPKAEEWIQETLDTLTHEGLINDREFARGRVAGQRPTLRQITPLNCPRFNSCRRIIGPSNQHPSGCIPNWRRSSELGAARAYVARRRLGHFRDDPEAYEIKELAALGRRGFPYHIARRALKKENEE